MNIDIEKNLEGLNDDCKELMRAQIELLCASGNKFKSERLQPLTFEEKLKERFGVLYSKDENTRYYVNTVDFWNNED